jgi:F-type H+-transporting ATPase subunit a
MANPVLHIKDSYYFEVPKVLCPSNFGSLEEFPAVWVSLDPEFQIWEFERLYGGLQTVKENSVPLSLAPKDYYQKSWKTWVESDHANHGKPFDVYVEEALDAQVAAWQKWQQAELAAAGNAKVVDEENAQRIRKVDFRAFLTAAGVEQKMPFLELKGMTGWLHEVKAHSAGQFGSNEWDELKSRAGDVREYKRQFREEKTVQEWSTEKIAGYNYHLSGKILIPQPFGGELRNLYEKEPGLTNIAVSKFMIVEVVVGIILIAVFSWLARKVAPGGPPKGKRWNFLETFVVFIRDQIAEPAIGHHDAHSFVPLLCTVFFFVLGCNLSGMIPWVGSPTGTFGVTFGLAMITFMTVLVSGMARFGFFGFFKNQIPSMDLPIYMAVVLKPMILAIELLGLVIKHAVLAVRLLANMVAGHLVILGIMGLAFGTHAALNFSAPDVPSWQWYVTATISVLGATAFNLLELFVAFLQAYIFTFLSALFIGAAIHHH